MLFSSLERLHLRREQRQRGDVAQRDVPEELRGVE